jgi:hypothetical protein
MKNWRTTDGVLPFSKRTCEIAARRLWHPKIELISPEIIKNGYVHTLRTKYSERSEKSFGLGTYLCENRSWLGSSGS